MFGVMPVRLGPLGVCFVLRVPALTFYSQTNYNYEHEHEHEHEHEFSIRDSTSHFSPITSHFSLLHAPSHHPSHPKNATITPTVSINPSANTEPQRFRPASK